MGNTSDSVMSLTLRDDPGFAKLAEYIRSRSRGEPFDFYASPGNWGDSLINEGSVSHFDAHGFEYLKLWRKDLTQRTGSRLPALAVVGGGGGWCTPWNSTPGFVEEVANAYENVILLPTTFDLRVAELDLPNVSYFSRDKSIAEQAASYCPDMAFFLEYPQRLPVSLKGPLICLRRDAERHRQSIYLDRNFDLSLLGNETHDSQGFISLLSRFKSILTDRLHVAIAGGMLGRDVKLLDGSYPKGRRVYEATIEGKLPNVSLISWREFKNIRLFAECAARS